MNKQSKYSKLIFAGEILIWLMLLTIIIVVFLFGLSDGNTLFIVDETLDLGSMFVVLAIYSSLSRDYRISVEKEYSTPLFIVVLLTITIGLFSDFFAWMVQGIPDYRIINEITNTIFYFNGPTAIFVYWLYCVKLSDVSDSAFFKKINIVQYIVYVISILAVVMNIFMGFYFTVNQDGVYQRTEGSFIFNAFPNVIMMIITVVIICLSKCEAREKRMLITLGLAPVLASVIQVFFFGVSVLYSLSTILALMIYSYIYFRRSEKLAQQKIKIMQAQLQPHFISNGMISIRTLIKKSPQDAVEMMDHFISYLRGSIEMFGNENLVNVRDELQFVTDYLEIEKTRFAGKIDCEIVDETENAFMIPPISIQPLVENAIRHGIRQTENGSGKVTIHLYSEGNSNIIEIADDGVGFDIDSIKNDGFSHIGLSNTEKRIRMLMGGRMEVKSVVGEGTIVKILLPMQK